MRKIFPLPEDTIAKIAAGEVIERPAYAVKELIENAIDARADLIQVHIEKSGLKRITVIDNGEGMSQEDLAICFLPHTTSKLKSTDTLLGIKTLGFRGEALSSLAAISTLSIKSREHTAPGGNEIVIKNGIVESITPVGMPPGTIFQADQLFNNVPARKKFLKSEKTEFRLITDIVTQFALAYPSIHFILSHNNKTVLDLSAKADSPERIRLLLGTSIFNQLIPVQLDEGHITITGFIGKPQIATKQNQKQFLFINGRSVNDKTISLAVKESFDTLLPATNSPIFLFHITIPPEIIDVNIHPRKETISFTDAKQIFDTVRFAVKTSLENHNLTFNLSKFKQESSAKIGETTSFAGNILKDIVLPWNRVSDISIGTSSSFVQHHQTYIITQTNEGLLLIDQHAAHERILFEQFTKTFLKQKEISNTYDLPKTQTISFSLNEVQILDEYEDFFRKLGFTIEPFQGDTYLVRQIPTVFRGRNIEKVIKELLSDLNSGMVKEIDQKTQRMLAFLSCRAAIKSGDVLDVNQMKEIVTELENTKNNETCPHGRPTRILFSTVDIDRLFKRK